MKAEEAASGAVEGVAGEFAAAGEAFAAAQAEGAEAEAEEAAEATWAAEHGPVEGVEAGEIEVTYATGWETAFIHYKLDDDEWTNPPGVPLDGDAVKAFSVEGSCLEFVLTDGEGRWDKPSDRRNYFIGEPGRYELRRGKLYHA